MNKNDNHKILLQFIAMATILFGLITGGMVASQNKVSAHVRRSRIKRAIRKPAKRTKRTRVHRRRTKATHQVKRAKRSRKVRRMVKHVMQHKTRGRRKQFKSHKEIRPVKIEHRETDKDPVSVSPENHE